MSSIRHVFGIFFLMVFGTLFIGIGIAMATVFTQQSRAEAQRVEQLAVLTSSMLENGQAGREVVVEGTLDPRNKSQFQEFIAYIREEYRGDDDDGDATWREDERQTPPLLIAIKDGTITLANDNYRLNNPPRQWQESNFLLWNGLTGEGTKRYSGFYVNDTVTALGTLTPGQEGFELQAEQLYGGTRSEYIAGQRRSAAMLPWMGAVFGVVGLAILGIGIWKLLRGR